MPPAVSRFGPQALGTPFQHLQQAQLHHHSSQHQPPGSGGLPPPSFNSHHNFAQAHANSSINPFAPTGNTNGLAAGFGSGGGLGGGGTGLASHAAVMGFAHGAQIQQRQEAMRRGSGGVGGKGQMKGRIRDVWRNNLAQEMHILRGLVEKYPYISMVSHNHFEDYYLRWCFCCFRKAHSWNRTPSSQELWPDRWVVSLQRQTTTIKLSAAMSISYESSS